MKKLFTIFISMAFLITSGQCMATPNIANGKVPTNITSAKVVYTPESQTVVFTGKVHIKRSDFELWSDKLTVYLEKSSSSMPGTRNMTDMQSGKIDRIIAEDNIIIKSGTKEAHAGKATYTASKEEFKLEGSPWIRDKGNVIKGQTIYHYINTNKSIVSGGVDVNFSAPDQTIRKKAQ